MAEKKDLIEVKDGYKVIHKIYGEGTVIAFDEKYIHARFKDGKHSFVFPTCFPKYLDTKDVKFQDIIIEAKRIAAENEDKRLKREQIYAILNPKMETSNPGNKKYRNSLNGPVHTTYVTPEPKKKSLLIEERKSKQEEERAAAIKLRQSAEAQAKADAVKERERQEEEHHAKVNAERRRREQERLYQAKEEERRRQEKEQAEAQKLAQLKKEIEQRKKTEEELRRRLEVQRKEKEEAERQARVLRAREEDRRNSIEKRHRLTAYEEELLLAEAEEAAELALVGHPKTDPIKGQRLVSPAKIEPIPNEPVIVAEVRQPKSLKQKFFTIIGIAVCLGMVLGGYHAYYSPEAKYTKQMRREGAIVTEEGTYQGDFYRGIINGDGEFTFASGNTYTGSWVENKFDGAGILTLANGDIINGQFDKGELTSGVYTREFDEGTLTRVIENGTPNDYIKVEFDDGTILYTDISDGEVNDGEITYPNGDEYIGELKNGLRHGEGEYSWSGTEESYAGEWNNGIISGKGIYTINSIETLDGTFVDGEFYDGVYTVDYTTTGSSKMEQVVYQMKNGSFNDRVVVKSNSATYTGTYNTNSGALTGTGTVGYVNSDSYQGPISNGVKAGSGLYNWSNGDKFDGAWSGDTMNGWGTYYFGSGGTKRLVGNFKNGKPNGTLTYYDAYGNKYITYWNNGTHTGSAYG